MLSVCQFTPTASYLLPAPLLLACGVSASKSSNVLHSSASVIKPAREAFPLRVVVCLLMSEADELHCLLLSGT